MSAPNVETKTIAVQADAFTVPTLSGTYANDYAALQTLLNAIHAALVLLGDVKA